METPYALGVEPIQEMLKSLKPDAVYGAPIKEGNTTLIPVSRVSYMFWQGAGYGRAPGDEAVEGEASEGGGGGGGGAARATPMGYIRIAPEGVAFEPIVDSGRLGLAGILLSAWSVFWITLAIRAFARK